MASIFDGYRPDEMIQGGFSGLGQVGQQAYGNYQHEQQMNQPLHPLAQQLLQQILGGQQGQPQPSPQPQMPQPDQQPIPYGPSQPQGPGPADIGRLMNRGAISDPVPRVSAEQLTAPYQMPGTDQPPAPQPEAAVRRGGALADSASADRMSQPQMSQPMMTSMGGQSRPLTQRDLATVQALAPFIAAQQARQRNEDTLQTRRDITALTEKGKGERTGQRLGQSQSQFEARQQLEQAKLEETKANHAANLQQGWARLAAIEKALSGKVSDKTVAQIQADINSARGYLGKVDAGLRGRMDPEVKAQADLMERKIQELEAQLQQKGIGGNNAALGPPAPPPSQGSRPAAAKPATGQAPAPKGWKRNAEGKLVRE